MYGIRPTRTRRFAVVGALMSGRLGGCAVMARQTVWRRVLAVEGAKDPIERITLCRLLPGSANERQDLVERHRLRGVRTCLVIDLLAHHCPLHVVDAEMERGLRDEGSDHHPVRLDVVDIVEEQPADGEI